MAGVPGGPLRVPPVWPGASFVVLDTDVASASFRGRLSDPLRARLTLRRGRPRPVNDTWIAACCLVRDLPLATLNVKDYADFAEHESLALLAW